MPKAKGFSEEGILDILKVLPESKKLVGQNEMSNIKT
jgi:hypothetical protein